MDTLTIGRLAELGGVHVETIRYYERRGLLRSPPRSAAGYRQYSEGDLGRLRFIARAKQLGFTLAEVGSLLGSSGDDCGAVLSMARAKITDIDQRRRTLKDTRSRLERLIDVCADPSNQDCAALRVS